MKTIYLTLALLLLPVSPSLYVMAQEPGENPSQEAMRKLEWMMGKWAHKGTWLPSGNDVTGEMHCDWLFEHVVLECEYPDEENPEKLSQRMTMSYDPNLKNYRIIGYYSEGGPMEGNFVNNGESWSLQAEAVLPEMKLWDQMILTPGGDKIDIVQYRSTNGGVVEKVQEAVMTKID